MKFNPIGSTFEEGSNVLLVKESKDLGVTCKGCWYNGWKNRRERNYTSSCYYHGHVCTPYYRKDKKHVIFEKINDIQKI